MRNTENIKFELHTRT